VRFKLFCPCALLLSQSRRTRLLLLSLAVAAAFVVNPLSRAQIPSLIQSQVDPSRIQPLLHHHPLWANSGNDIGPVAPSQVIESLTLVLRPQEEQQLAFEQFLSDQQNPASPEFHHWLTPAQVGERFGLSDADVSAIAGWLQSQGLRVIWVAPSRMFLGFAGTAADISRAFQSELHNYKVNGKNLVSISSDPTIPDAVAPAIRAIRGLYTIDEQPQHVSATMQLTSPELTTSNGTHFIIPGDFYSIYDLPNSLSGSGVTIGIVGRSRTDPADFDNFKSLAGSGFTNPTEVVPTALGGVDPGPAYTAPPGSGKSIADQSEATLDVLRAGSVAHNAQLLLVVATAASGGIGVDAQYLVNTNPVPAQVMSISFGACESAAGSSGVTFWDTLFKQAAAEGISTFVSSGDSGASGCDADFQAPPSTPQPNSPNYICSSSYAVCVGGTEFNDKTGQYWAIYTGNVNTSAFGYIPEGAWNESWDGTTSVVASGGGGVSSFVPTPSWQKGIAGVPSAYAGRYTPDVSFSSSLHDGYFGCFAAAGGSCVLSVGSFSFSIFGGTSAAAPSMAGIAALLDENAAAPQGNLGPGIYQMSMGAPTAFHDVTLASSGISTCDLHTPSLCNNSIPGPSGLSGGQQGYAIGTGYDEVTGLGSLDASTFVYAYATASKIMTPVVTINTLQTVPTNQPFDVSAFVVAGPYSPNASGTVNLTIGTYTASTTLSGPNAASFSLSAGVLPVGTYTVKVSYTPDAASAGIYTSASATQSLTVIVPPKVSPEITLTPSQQIISNSQAMTVGVVVAPTQYYPVPTGSVKLTSGTYNSASVVLSAGSATFSIPPGSLAVGNDTLTVTYTPDSASSSSYLVTSNYTFVQNDGATINPSVWVSVDPSYPTTAQAISAYVTVNGFQGNPIPTGKVVLTSGTYQSAQVTLANGSATINIPVGSLPAGIDNVTVTYTPDTHSGSLYSSSASSLTVGIALAQKVNPAVTFTQITPSPTTIQPLSMTINLSGGAGNPAPSGAVRVGAANANTVDAPLTAGSATVSLLPGSFTSGADVITVQYFPDTNATYFYNTESVTTTVNVAKATPTVMVTTDLSNASTTNSINVAATVSGGTGTPNPTGQITLSSGIYSVKLPLTTGAIAFMIPAGSLVPGTDTLTATYSGDNNYSSTIGTSTVTVTAPADAGFSIACPSTTVLKGFGSSLKTTVTPTTGFVGSVSLTAEITGQPQGAQYPPAVSFGTTSPLNVLGFNPTNAILSISTTPATTGLLRDSRAPGKPWYAAAGATLACCVLLFVPIRRRRARLVAMLALGMFLTGGVISCGGGSGGQGGGGGGNSGTTSGQYTITITGTSGATTATTTMTVTVQ
jgi:subtilase family serine protease